MPLNFSLFLAGGSVRDLLLERKPSDLDFIVTTADPDRLLWAMLLSSSPFNCDFERRVIRYSKRDYFVCHDLAEKRADFTVNALLKDGSGTIIDPTGRGIQDLRNRVLDPVAHDCFSDTTRVFRAMRFERTLNFKPTALCIELARESMATAIREASPWLLAKTTKTAILNSEIPTDEQRAALLKLWTLRAARSRAKTAERRA